MKFKKLLMTCICCSVLMQVTNIYANESENINYGIKVQKKIEPTTQSLFDKDYYEEYYDTNSGWQVTFEKLGEYVGNRELDDVFGSINNKLKNNSNVSDEEVLANVFYNDLLREIYVVDLVNENSGTKTTIDNWKFNLEFLTNNYDAIVNNPNTDIPLIDSYIEDYSIQLQIDHLPDFKETNPVSTKSYSWSKVKSYIDQYWNTFNRAYPDWTNYGGDCANFVSQCLYAGGKSMVGTPGTSSAADNWNNWFSTGSANSTTNVSSTWRGANAFKSFWLSKGQGYKYYAAGALDSNYHVYYGSIGDAVSITNPNKVARHTMIVYTNDYKDLTLAGHTSPTKSGKFMNYYGLYGGGSYIIIM